MSEVILAERAIPRPPLKVDQIKLGGAIYAQRDPSGLDQHAAGAKLDAGKLRAGLVLGGFARALQEVAAVGTFGANKYSDNGWVSVDRGVQRYTDAMWRHLLVEQAGELIDPESKLRHAAHAAWNALAVLELTLRAQDATPK